MTLAEQNEWPREILKSLRKWDFLGLKTLADGAQLIGHVPAVAPLAYLHRIPSPLSPLEIDEVESTLGRQLPHQLKILYSFANGLSLFSDAVGVYGHRKSYQRSDFLRASAQPFDIGLPNGHERPSGLSPNEVVVGYYGQDGSEVVADLQNRVYRCQRSNARRVFNRWPTIQFWLSSEVARLSALFDDTGSCRDKELLLPAPIH